MKRLAGTTTLVLMLSATGGCSWLWGDEGYFRDRGSDYRLASQQAPMQVPSGVETRVIEPLLPIPQQIPAASAEGNFKVPRPPQQTALSEQARVAEQGGSVSLLGERDYDAPARVNLVQDAGGTPLLQLDSDFDRAWSRVGRALQSADVRVDDLNRSLGIYYINLAEGAEQPGERPGFFARLFGGGADADASDARAERYQVRLVEAAGEVRVSVEQDLDTLAPADVARRVLTLIQDNLG